MTDTLGEIREQEELEQRIAVRSEPLTYRRDVRHSYYQDLFLRSKGDAKATERLTRHAQEMDVEYRVNPNRTDGQGGYFAPPLWLNYDFATAKRAERVLADMIDQAGNRFPCPANGQSVNIPVLTTGTSEAGQQDLAADQDTDLIDTATTSPIVSVSGQSDVALQLLEQSPAGAHLDKVVYKDLTSAYDQALEVMLLNGTGVGETFTGLLNLTGINKVTYTATTPSFASALSTPGMYTYIGQAIGQVGDNRDIAPEVLFMRTARWAWIGTQNDNQYRPITTPDLAPPPEKDTDGTSPTASMLGWPLVLNDALPATLGTAANQDVIVACRPSDLFLFEGDAKTTTMEEVLSGTLSVRFQLRNYAAAILGRYPSGIATVTGTGMAVQSGF